MNASPLTVQALSAKGTPTTILAQQTGVDALSLHLIGDGSNTYNITHVRRVAEGVYEGETSIMMQNPHIRIEVGNGVKLIVTHTWWNPAPINFLVSSDKAKDINSWLDAAQFPQAYGA